jgi:hypothetical protein
MNRLLVALGLLAALVLAGCSGGGGGSGGVTISNSNSNDDKDHNSPGAGLVEMVAVLGCALLVRRRMGA